MVTRMKFTLILMGVASIALIGHTALADSTVGNEVPNISYFVNTGEIQFYDDLLGGVFEVLLNGPVPAVTGEIDWVDSYGGGAIPLPGSMPGDDGGLWDVRYFNGAQQYINLGGLDSALGTAPPECGAGCVVDVEGAYILADYGLGLVGTDFGSADYGNFAGSVSADTSIDLSLAGDYDGDGLRGRY